MFNDEKPAWRSPLRIGTAIGIALMYSSVWINGFDMVTKLFWAGAATILITFTLFLDG